ncbi:MAG: hypothetical protein QM523_00860 [Candidatus Pacebacteria bacterium]|nr:hypothetical protein [Candidatus Paceibacterota bacterium]
MENKAPHLIKQWLANDGRKASWLAEKVGASRPTMSGWLNQGVLPIAIYRAKLAEVTGLAVAERGAWK